MRNYSRIIDQIMYYLLDSWRRYHTTIHKQLSGRRPSLNTTNSQQWYRLMGESDSYRWFWSHTNAYSDPPARTIIPTWTDHRHHHVHRWLRQLGFVYLRRCCNIRYTYTLLNNLGYCLNTRLLYSPCKRVLFPLIILKFLRLFHKLILN